MNNKKLSQISALNSLVSTDYLCQINHIFYFVWRKNPAPRAQNFETKGESLRRVNISHQKASQYELMAANPKRLKINIQILLGTAVSLVEYKSATRQRCRKAQI